MSGAITERDAQYAFDIVKRICDEVGPGLPGSAQERERAAILKNELGTHLGAENVALEEFTVAPRAFLASLPIGALFTVAAVLLNLSTGQLGVAWVTAALALVYSAIAVLVVTLEFFLSFEVIDRFFPKVRSVNVIGTLRHPATQDVKRLLLLSGHHDSAPENTWLRLLGYGGLIASSVMPLGFIAMFGLSILQLIGVLVDDAGLVRLGTVGWILLAFPVVPSIITGLFFTRGNKGGGNVPGAVDNLAACALLVSLCEFLVKNPAYIPADTEIRFITFGSEEAGLRGSRRYAERHREELERLDARLLNIEMVADPRITILSSDLNGSVKSPPALVESLVAAAESAGVPYEVKPAGLGIATDAGPFRRLGLKAATLFPFKVPQQLVSFYHQKWDRPEVVTLPPLLHVMKLALAWLRSSEASTSTTASASKGA